MYIHSVLLLNPPGNSDFIAIINHDVGPFSSSQRQQCFLVEIANDKFPENLENFFANLKTRPGEMLQQVTINPTVAEVTMDDNDRESRYSKSPTVSHTASFLQSKMVERVVLVIYSPPLNSKEIQQVQEVISVFFTIIRSLELPW